MPKPEVRREVKKMPTEFAASLDAGMSQAQLRKKFLAGDATIDRWRDEVYIDRAESIRRRK